MHKASDYNDISWQSSAIEYAGSRPVLFKPIPNQPIAYNKAIDNPNQVLQSFPIGLLDRNNNMVKQLTLVPDNTTYETPNGLPYEIARNTTCMNDNPYVFDDGNKFNNMIRNEPSAVVTIDGSTFMNQYKQKVPSIYGTNIVPTNHGKRVKEDYKMEYGRVNTKPTGSNTNIFGTVKQSNNIIKNKRYPMMEKKKDNDHYKTEVILNNNENNQEKINIEDNKYYTKSDKKFLNTPDVIKQDLNINIVNEPLKQQRHKYNNVINDFENNLPIYMRNLNKNEILSKIDNLVVSNMSASEVTDVNTSMNPVDAHTNKLLNNNINPFVEKDEPDDNIRPIFSAHSKHNRNTNSNQTASNNSNIDKVKENSYFDDGINEPSTGRTIGSEQKERTAIIENFSSVNRRRKEMENDFKENKYNMHYNTIIENPVEYFQAPRGSDSSNANMSRNLMSVYMHQNVYDSNVINNKNDDTPFIYNFNGYEVKDSDNNRSRAEAKKILPEFDTFQVNDFEYIYDKEQSDYNDRKQLLNNTNSKQNDMIKINNSYNTNENIMEGFTPIQKEYINNEINKERFTGATKDQTAEHIYISVLKAYALVLSKFLVDNKDFSTWRDNWEHMFRNIEKSAWDFKVLDKSDADVAYVENKGEMICFRIRDDKRWVPISVYTYVLCHELAHLANYNEWGHGQNFQDLMHLIEVAAFELGIIKPEKYPKISAYTSNGTTILSKESIKKELYSGINLIMARNSGNKDFYNNMIDHIKSL